MKPAFKKVNLFKEFNDQELDEVSNISRKVVIQQGELAFREEDIGDSLLIINLGSIRLLKKIPEGEEAEIAVLSTYDYVGEMALFGKMKRSASGKALERSELIQVPYQALMTLLDAKPVMAAKFYKNIASGISQRLRVMNEEFSFLKNYCAKERRA